LKIKDVVSSDLHREVVFENHDNAALAKGSSNLPSLLSRQRCRAPPETYLDGLALDLQKVGKADVASKKTPCGNERTTPLHVGLGLVEDVPVTPIAARLQPDQVRMDRDNGIFSTLPYPDGHDIDGSSKDGEGMLVSRAWHEDGTPLRHISAAILQLTHGDVSSDASRTPSQFCKEYDLFRVSSEAPAQICKDSDDVVESDGELLSCGAKRALSEASTLATDHNDSDAEDHCGVFAV